MKYRINKYHFPFEDRTIFGYCIENDDEELAFLETNEELTNMDDILDNINQVSSNSKFVLDAVNYHEELVALLNSSLNYLYRNDHSPDFREDIERVLNELSNTTRD